MGDLLAADTRRRVALALAVVAVVLFLALAIVATASDLPRLEVRLAPGWLALSLGCFLLFQPLLVECWRRVLREAGGDLPVLRGHAIYNVSLLARYVPTQLLMAVTRIELAQRAGVARTVSVAGFAYEFALAVGTSLALGAWWMISLDALEGQPVRWLLLGAPVVLLLALHPRFLDGLESRLAKRFGVESTRTTIPVMRLTPYVFAYLAAWAIGGLGVYALARGIHPVGAPDFTVISSYAIGYVAATIAFVLPAGLGARDAATASALSSAMPFSVALAAAVGTRLLQTAMEIGYAGVTAIWAKRTDARAQAGN